MVNAGHYFLDVRIIGRSAGHSSVAAAAYRAGEKIHDERQGVTHDYTRKGFIEAKAILAPDNSPEWIQDRAKLWNEVEKKEIRKDAQLAREVIVSLPRELPSEQRQELVKKFVTEQFVNKGMVADVSFHTPQAGDGGENPHAHILLTMRDLSPEGFRQKNREWNTAIFTKDDQIKDKSQLVGLRAAWADYVNDTLADSGSDTKISHLSYEAQGIDKTPHHLPTAAYKIHQKGDYSAVYYAKLHAKHDQHEEYQNAMKHPEAVKASRHSAGVEDYEYIKARKAVEVDSRNYIEPSQQSQYVKKIFQQDIDNGVSR